MVNSKMSLGLLAGEIKRRLPRTSAEMSIEEVSPTDMETIRKEVESAPRFRGELQRRLHVLEVGGSGLKTDAARATIFQKVRNFGKQFNKTFKVVSHEGNTYISRVA